VKHFKAIVYISTIIFVLTSAVQAQGPLSRFVPSAPKNVKIFKFTDADNNEISIKEYEGKITLVHFWTTWCNSCVYEMPSLNHLATLFNHDDFKLIAISKDQDRQVAENFLRHAKLYNIKLYHDANGSASRSLNATSLPTTILLNRKGEEIGRLVGATEWDRPEIAQLIQRHLE
jgi:thiol-disulfide isomerase/thioredoxin